MAGNSFLQSPFDSITDTLKGATDVSLPPATTTAREEARIETPKTGKTISAPADLLPVFEASAKAFDVPVNVLMALGHQESRFNPNAIGPATQWGRAKGMMQYLDDTAKNLGINPFDPNEAIPAAAKQLRERLNKGYSMEDAVKEHFAGPDRKLWGEKTSAYGKEVMAKAGLIGDQFLGGGVSTKERSTQAATDLNKDEPGRYKPIDDDWISTHLSPALPRPLYEYGLKLVNPKADDAFIAGAMKDYDAAQESKTEAGANAVQGRFDTLTREGGQFQQKLDQRLAGPQNGIVPQLPTSSDMKLADENSNFEKEVARQQGETGDFMRRFYDSGRQAKALAEGTLGLFGDISQRNIGIGGDLKDWGYKKYREDMAITEQRAKPSDDAVYVYQKAKEGDFGPVVDYLQGGAGYLTGQTLEALVAALGGAAIGAAAGTTVPVAGNIAGAVGGAAAGLAEKTAIKKFIGSAIEKRLAAYAAEAAGKGMADAEAKQYAKQVLGAQVLGSLTGSQAYNLSQELGTTYGGARDEKKGGELTGGEVAKATAAGTAAAAIETLGDAFGFSRFLKGASTPKQGVMSYIGAIAKEAGINMTSEGAQELAQTALERYGSGQDLTNEDAARDYINSTLLGALGGGARGTAAGAITNRSMLSGGGNAPVRTPEPAQPDQTVTVTPPEPSQASGPLTRAVENAATEPARVKVTAPQGEITGFVDSHTEDSAGNFKTRVIGDDGQIYTFSNADDVTITPEKGPLTGAVEKAAEQAQPKQPPITQGPAIWSNADHDLPVEVVGIEQQPGADGRTYARVRREGVESFVPADELVAPKTPAGAGSTAQPTARSIQPEAQLPQAEAPATPPKAEKAPFVEAKAPDTAPAIEDMSEEELRARLKYIASQAKNSGGWNKMLIDERRKVERVINKRADAAKVEAQKEAPAAQAGDTEHGNPAAPEPSQQSKNSTQGESKNIDLSGRTDDQLAYMAEKGKPGFKESAQAEITKRKEATNGRPDGSAGSPGGAVADNAPGVGLSDRGPVAVGGDTGAPATSNGQGESADVGAANPQPALKDAYAGKWFGSAEKAKAFLDKKKIGATHEAVQTGKVRWEVKPKAEKKEAPIVRYTREAAEIEKSLPPVQDGFTRLWRGNRKGEVGKNPQFTNSLPGIALPFRDAYGGDLSYVDVPEADVQKYVNTGVAAEGSEFILPSEIANKAKAVEKAEAAPAESAQQPTEGSKHGQGQEEGRRQALLSETGAAAETAAPERSDQFKAYATAIRDGKASRGMLEQIKADERLNDGEAEALNEIARKTPIKTGDALADYWANSAGASIQRDIESGRSKTVDLTKKARSGQSVSQQPNATTSEQVESPSELAKIFDDLSAKSPLVRKRATADLKNHPLAEKIAYVQSHILDILGELEDSGKVKINCD